MKKILLALVLITATTLIFFSCDLFSEETYFFDSKDDGGTCVSLTSSKLSFKTAVKAAGWELGDCSTENSLGECGGCNEIPKDKAEMFGEGDSDDVEKVVDIINTLIDDGTSFGVVYYIESVDGYQTALSNAGDDPVAITAAKAEANEELSKMCSEIDGKWEPGDALK